MEKIKLVFATNNANKLKEIKALLNGSFQILSLSDIDCEEDIPETSDSIQGNAIQKANYVSSNYNFNCFADDTGLLVDALNGEPGIYSARYAGPNRKADDNINLLLEKLKNQKNRNAHFKTVIALNLDGRQYLFSGICKGVITNERHGNSGFGYDPVFRPIGYKETFAEMSLEAKNEIGHRGKAFRHMITFLETYV